PSSRERPAAARVAQDQLLEGLGPAFEEDRRQTAGGHDAERVAIAAGILGGDQPLLGGETHEESTTLAQEGLREPSVVLTRAEVAAQAQQVVQLIGVSRRAAELCLDLVDCACIEQVAELLL